MYKYKTMQIPSPYLHKRKSTIVVHHFSSVCKRGLYALFFVFNIHKICHIFAQYIRHILTEFLCLYFKISHVESLNLYDS